jgi:hypothetical protein
VGIVLYMQMYVDLPMHTYIAVHTSPSVYYSGIKLMKFEISKSVKIFAAWSSGIVSAYHRRDWSFGSRDRIPPVARVKGGCF